MDAKISQSVAKLESLVRIFFLFLSLLIIIQILTAAVSSGDNQTWANVGKTPGLQIFRAESYRLVCLTPNEIGSFYSGAPIVFFIDADADFGSSELLCGRLDRGGAHRRPALECAPVDRNGRARPGRRHRRIQGRRARCAYVEVLMSSAC